MAEPWAQLIGETDRAYAAFRTFRDLGAARTLPAVRNQWGEIGAKWGCDPDRPPTKSSVDRWASDHHWRTRARAYDEALDAEWVNVQRESRRTTAQRNARIAGFALDKIEERLKTIDWDELDVLDIRRLVESMGKLERLALGDTTENVQITGPAGGPVQLGELSDDAARARLIALRDEADRRLREDL